MLTLPLIPSASSISQKLKMGSTADSNSAANGPSANADAGTATILAIGTAVPPNWTYQADYPDLYFRITNSEHMETLKNKFKLFCQNSTIRKRHGCLSKKILEDNPNLCEYMAPSLDTRSGIVMEELPKLAKEAAARAIEEWGRPASEITHLVFGTTCTFGMPGPDAQLVKLLGLPNSVKRTLIHLQGCFVGAMLLRLAKDAAENNRGARVLVVSAETMIPFFRGPSPDESYLDHLVGQALFGDGAAAVVVGSNPVEPIEKPIFEITACEQAIVPNSEEGISGYLKEVGVTYHLRRDIPILIANSIGTCLKDAFGVSDWDSVFLIVHPGGPVILDLVQAKLRLSKEKLRAARHVLSEYGNMSSATVLFILDEVRRRSKADGLRTTGEGLESGLLVGIGPGVTMEMVKLRSVPINENISAKDTSIGS